MKDKSLLCRTDFSLLILIVNALLLSQTKSLCYINFVSLLKLPKFEQLCTNKQYLWKKTLF